MLTFNELMEVLKIRYTAEEIPEVLKIDTEDLVDNLTDYIQDNYEEIHKQLEEDGYVEGDEDE